MTLEVLTSDLFDNTVKHGFFTRKGGASSGVFAGLNCGFGSSDQEQVVALNRARVAQHFKVSQLEAIHQTHSADVVVIEASGQGAGKEADGLVTNQKGLALTVLTADCQPVLFADTQAGVIGAAHAGWKGALTGVLEATLTAMEGLGALRSNISAVIGPCISQENYEVGSEFQARFVQEDPDYAHFFQEGLEGKYQFDLSGFGLMRLRKAGVTQASWTGHCTYADESRFFSFRRSTHKAEADYGRLIAGICL